LRNIARQVIRRNPNPESKASRNVDVLSPASRVCDGNACWIDSRAARFIVEQTPLRPRVLGVSFGYKF
jgi:hypothetical protein